MFQAGDVVETDFEGFLKLLRSKTRAFVSINDHEYYITHTDGYWRVQDCEALNDKGHFTDCSELVNTVCEVVELPWICGKSLHDSFSGATVYEAVAAYQPTLDILSQPPAPPPAPAVFFVDMLMKSRP